MKEVKVIITDLDDTIWDWMAMWYESFNPYFERISAELSIDKNELIKDFKKLHQKYHTSEVSYAYKELKSIKNNSYNKFEEDSNESTISILHQYYRNKKLNLKLYDGVRETLETIKSKGVKIIGFTESNIFYTKYRIKTLNLDGIFDIIYTPEDHEIPVSVNKFYSDNHWETHLTKFEVLPNGFAKPNPDILNEILQNNNIRVNDAIYVGDKLDRDVYMAAQIGMTSIHAVYGNIISDHRYDLLKKVTHWTPEQVQREINFKNNISGVRIEPNYSISKFSELLTLFNYIPFSEKSIDDKKIIIEIWKSTIEVQKHFNDIEIKIRNFAITIITFIYAGIGFCFKDNQFFNISGVDFSLATVFMVVGAMLIFAIYLMDQHWYHRLLYAAVDKGREIEKSISIELPQVKLTNEIKDKSPFKLLGLFKIDSKGKIRLFYILLLTPLLLGFGASLKFSKISKIKNELEYVEKNSKRVISINENVPQTAGLIIVINSDKKLFAVKEVDNLSNGLFDISNYYWIKKIDIFKNKKVYYCETQIGRIELEEFINNNGISLK